jgi:hypothetical protein
MTSRTLRRAATLLVGVAATAVAQDTSARDTSKVPLRQLGPVEAKTTVPVSNITTVRALSNGAVYLNDFQQRQLLLFDPTLQNVRIVADTLEAPIPYGQRNIGLLPFVGDSTLLIDPATYSMLVLDPRGEQVRVIAPPRPADINILAGIQAGTHHIDAQGRLVYRANLGGAGGRGGFNPGMMMAMGGGGAARGGEITVMAGGPPGAQGQQGGRGGQQGGRGGFTPVSPDSAPIVRADFETRKVDTIGHIRLPRTSFATTTTPEGNTRLTARINPLPQQDEWALMADGTVAIVRVLDYRVNFIDGSGKSEFSPRLPYEWKRLEEKDKQALVDSMKGLAARITEQFANQTRGSNFLATFEPVPPEELPDYYPPIRAGAVRADADGNLWILPTTTSEQTLMALAAQTLAGGMGGGGRGGPPPGVMAMMGGAAGGGRGGDAGAVRGGGAAGAGAAGAAGATGAAGAARGAQQQAAGAQRADSARAGQPPQGNPAAALMALAGAAGQPQVGFIYDIVNRKGELVERIQLPVGRTLVGFGPGGVVYLAAREGRGMVLERMRRVQD